MRTHLKIEDLSFQNCPKDIHTIESQTQLSVDLVMFYCRKLAISGHNCHFLQTNTPLQIFMTYWNTQRQKREKCFRIQENISQFKKFKRLFKIQFITLNSSNPSKWCQWVNIYFTLIFLSFCQHQPWPEKVVQALVTNSVVIVLVTTWGN